MDNMLGQAFISKFDSSRMIHRVNHLLRKYPGEIASAKEAAASVNAKFTDFDVQALGAILDQYKGYAGIVDERGQDPALDTSVVMDALAITYGASSVRNFCSMQPIPEVQGLIYFEQLTMEPNVFVDLARADLRMHTKAVTARVNFLTAVNKCTTLPLLCTVIDNFLVDRVLEALAQNCPDTNKLVAHLQNTSDNDSVSITYKAMIQDASASISREAGLGHANAWYASPLHARRMIKACPEIYVKAVPGLGNKIYGAYKSSDQLTAALTYSIYMPLMVGEPLFTHPADFGTLCTWDSLDVTQRNFITMIEVNE